jgi:pimeloyl-ACP methyl ester carboxylesterase
MISCGPGFHKGEKVSVVKNTKSSDGLKITYEVNGIVNDTALVFIHGWASDRSYWKNQVPFFAKDYMMVTVDLGGHGESGQDRENFTMTAFADDVVAVIKKLKVKKVILIGHSMGGGVAFQVSLKIPETVVAIVGVETFQNLTQDIPDEAVNSFIASYRKNFDVTIRNHMSNLFAPETDSTIRQWIVDDMASSPPGIAINSIENYLRTKPSTFIKKIQVPVYSINSVLFNVNIEGNKKLLKTFEVFPMYGVGHFPHLEDPNTFNLLLREIIRSRIDVVKGPGN